MLTPDEQAVTHLPAGEGETLWVLGVFVTLKAQSDEISLYEVICPPEAGPPPNIHHHQDEAFYVLENFSFLSGDETIETEPRLIRVDTERHSAHIQIHRDKYGQALNS